MKEILSSLTWVEYLAVLVVLWGFAVGFKSGFFPELLRVASYLVTVIATILFYEELAQFLTLNTFLNAATSAAVSFGVLLTAVFLLTKLLSMLILKLLKMGEGGFVNRLTGMLIGGCRWIILLSLTFMLIDRSPLETLKTDIHTRSTAGPKIALVAPLLFDFLSRLSPQLTVPTPKVK